MRLNSILSCLVLFSLGHSYALTNSIISVISSTITQDGRPILWQNLQSDMEDVECLYFRGPTYHFIGTVVNQDTSGVFAGLNTAGFALVVSKSIFPGRDEAVELAAVFMKYALGTCGRIEEFATLLSKTTNLSTNEVAFACMDAYDEAALFEIPENRRLSLNPLEIPEGFVVRAGFNLSGTLTLGEDFWRYHRARQLIKEVQAENQLLPATMLKTVARDLQTLQLDPYPLPFEGQIEDAPYGYVKCLGSINQVHTQYGVVIQGVRRDENPDFSTLWVMLGEPICSVALPIWPASGEVPIECQGKRPLLNSRIRALEKLVYNHSAYPFFVNTYELAHPQRGLWVKLAAIEERLFQKTRAHKILWHQSPNYRKEMLHYQRSTAAELGRLLR